MAKPKRPPRNKKKDPILRKVVFKIPMGWDSDKEEFGPVEITFKMIATPKNWQRLCHFSPDNDDDMSTLGQLMYINVLKDMKKHLEDEIFVDKPRGIHAKRQKELLEKTRIELTKERKIFAAAAMILTKYWISFPEKQWPLWFSLMIQEFQKAEADIVDLRSNKFNANKIVYCWWKQKFQSQLNNPNIKGPKDFNSFRQTYVNNNTHMKMADLLTKKGFLTNLMKVKHSGIMIDEVINSFL